jgi:hypothetical protein
MGRMCVAGHQNFWCEELEECGIKWGRMAGNSEEGQGPQRAVAPVMMMMMMLTLTYLIHASYTLRCRGFAESPPCSPVFRQLLGFFPRYVLFDVNTSSKFGTGYPAYSKTRASRNRY